MDALLVPGGKLRGKIAQLGGACTCGDLRANERLGFDQDGPELLRGDTDGIRSSCGWSRLHDDTAWQRRNGSHRCFGRLLRWSTSNYFERCKRFLLSFSAFRRWRDTDTFTHGRKNTEHWMNGIQYFRGQADRIPLGSREDVLQFLTGPAVS